MKKTAMYQAVVADVVDKPKRKRRTKAEMQALRAAASQAVVHHAVALAPKKRKRRTKAEMQAFREEQARLAKTAPVTQTTKKSVKETVKVSDTRVTLQEKAKTSCRNSSGKNQTVFKFGSFVVKALDKNNLSLELQDGDASVFLGYYQPTASSLIKLLEDVGARLLVFPKLGNISKALMSQKQQMAALSDVNTLLDAFHKFRTFLRSEFISENKDQNGKIL